MVAVPSLVPGEAGTQRGLASNQVDVQNDGVVGDGHATGSGDYFHGEFNSHSLVSIGNYVGQCRVVKGYGGHI